MKFNMPIVGFVIGLLLPVLGFFIVYVCWGNHAGISTFIPSVAAQRGMAGKVLLLSILPNLIPFAYCNIKRLDYAMRGIFIATMLYALAEVIIMFVW